MSKTFRFKKHMLKALLLFLSFVYTATADVPDSDLFPYLEQSGSTRFYFADDDFTNTTLQQSYKFLGTIYSTAFINGNGIITFGNGTRSHNYYCNQVSATPPTILAFMADSNNGCGDGSTTAKLLYRQDTSTPALNKISEDVYTAFPALRGGIRLNWMLIVTWYNIPSHSSNSAQHYDLRNTFQAVITTDGVYSFVVFYFNRITWPIEEWSPAQSGIFGGARNPESSFLIPGSCTHSLINIPSMSNINIPGKFVYRVDTKVTLPSIFTCSPSILKPIRFEPTVVPVIGSEPVLVQGINQCLLVNEPSVICTYQETVNHKPIKLQAVLAHHRYNYTEAVICPFPEFSSLGKMQVNISIYSASGQVFTTFGFVYVVQAESQTNLSIHSLVNNTRVGIRWDRNDFNITRIENLFRDKLSRVYPETSKQVDISVVDLRGYKWNKLQTFRDVTNNGSWSNSTQSIAVYNQIDTARVLKISHVVSLRNDNKLKVDKFTDIVQTTLLLAKYILRAERGDVTCQQLHDYETPFPIDTLVCPVTHQKALGDWRFSQEMGHVSTSDALNPLKFKIFLQSNPSSSGATSQCSYNTQGELVSGYPSGSRIIRYSPNSRQNYGKYYDEDLLPYLYCCQLSYDKEESCKKRYFSKRLHHLETEYVPPQPFYVIGASHVYTLDGASYMINGIGTFWLLKYPGILEIQVLLEKYSHSTANDLAVVTNVVVNCFSAKFQVTADTTNGLLIWMDNEPLNFYRSKTDNKYKPLKKVFTLYHDGATVYIAEQSEVLFSFASGFSTKFLLSVNKKGLNIIGSASVSFRGKVNGLLGNFDGISENDLPANNGTLLNKNSTLATVFEEFVDQWRVPQNESFFLFPSGKTYQSYNYPRPQFRSIQLSRNSLLRYIPVYTKLFCQNIESCNLDYQLSKGTEIANGTLTAYGQFAKLLNNSKVKVFEKFCEPPRNLSNGGFLGDSNKLGAIIQPFCEKGYNIYIYDKDGEAILANNGTLMFICAVEDVKNYRDKGVAWVSTSDSRHISNFSINCFSNSALRQILEQTKSLKVQPSVISIVGNVPIYATFTHNLNPNQVREIICHFSHKSHTSGFTKTTGVLIGVQIAFSTVMCPVPVLATLGKMNIRLEIKYLGKPPLSLEGHFWVQKMEEDFSKLSLFINDNKSLTVSWNVSKFERNKLNNESCELNNFQINNNKFLKKLETVQKSKCVSPEIMQHYTQKLSVLEMLTSPPILVLTNNQAEVIAAADILTWAVTSHDLTMSNFASDHKNEKSLNQFDELCKQWYDNEKHNFLMLNVLPCPRSMTQAKVDWRFTLADNHSSVYVQTVPSSTKSGSKCVYDKNGILTFGSPKGSLIHRYSSNSWVSYWEHFTEDALPYLYCCKWGMNTETSCQRQFYEKRGMPLDLKYSPPKLAQIWNGNYLQTFDGKRYQMDGTGMFWLIKYENRRWKHFEKFHCQVNIQQHMIPSVHQNHTNKLTVIKQVVMEQSIQNNIVQVQVSPNVAADRGFDVYLDGDLVDAEVLQTIYHEGVTILLNSQELEILVVFQLGYSFKFLASEDNKLGLDIIVSTDGSLINNTSGILGNLNTDSRNLQTINGMWAVAKNESFFADDPINALDTHYEAHSATLKLVDLPANKAERKGKSVNLLEEIIQASYTVIVECPPPGEIEGGRLSITSLVVGSTLQVICENGNSEVSTQNLYTCVAFQHLAKWEASDEEGFTVLSTKSCVTELEDEEDFDVWSTFNPPYKRLN